MMAKDPGERLADGGEVMQALQQVSRGETPTLPGHTAAIAKPAIPLRHKLPPPAAARRRPPTRRLR
jgi:hypothetical protein